MCDIYVNTQACVCGWAWEEVEGGNEGGMGRGRD